MKEVLQIVNKIMDFRYAMYKGIEKNQNYTWLICVAQNMKNIANKISNRLNKIKNSFKNLLNLIKNTILNISLLNLQEI